MPVGDFANVLTWVKVHIVNRLNLSTAHLAIGAAHFVIKV